MTTGKRRIPINGRDPQDPVKDPAGGPTGPSGGISETPAAARPAASPKPKAASKTPPGTENVATEDTAARDADTVPSTGPADVGASCAAGATGTTAAADIVELEKLIRERDALADQLLRLRAEFDNYRKRAAREVGEVRDRSQGELLSDLLPVLDNLDRALDAAEHHDEGKVLAGVRMTRDMFVTLLKRMGVEEIETVGATFDPLVHDALLMQASDEVEEGQVSAVLERGYRLGERVLRPAKVAVSSGPADSGSGQ